MTKSAAQKLGSKGGKRTATKRTPEERSSAAKKAAESRWKPDPRIFERALAGDWFSAGNPKYVFSDHRAKILLKHGYVTVGRVKKNEYADRPQDNWNQIFYLPTAAGMEWWITERNKARPGSPCNLSDLFDGKGIGSLVSLDLWYDGGAAAFAAMREGLIEFGDYRHYSGLRYEEDLTVKLTRKGMAYFDSLPKLIEVWE